MVAFVVYAGCMGVCLRAVAGGRCGSWLQPSLPVLVAGDPVGDERHSLAMAVFVPETTRQHDHLPLELSGGET